MSPATKTDIRGRIAGAASASGDRACARAVEAAVGDLGREPGLVLIFPSGDIDAKTVARKVHAAAGGAHVAGMTGTGVIAEDRLVEEGCSAIAFSSSLLTGIGASERADARAAGRDAAAEALVAVADAPHSALLLFVDSESGDQAEFVAGAYEVAGGRIPLAGGAAGGR